jgi:ribosomal-protein-alanine N-acetyltransferase
LLECHAEAMFALFAEPDIWTYLDDSPPATLEALATRHRRLESRRSPDEREVWLNWAVMLEGELIGFVQATVSSERRIDLAYVIGKPYWSRGLATDAVQTMVAFLEDRFPAAELQASVDERNGSSIRLLTRLGLTLDDRSDPQNLRFRRRR